MSKIGKKPVLIPETVKIFEKDGLIKVSGPNGELEFKIPPNISVELTADKATVSKTNNLNQTAKLHGLFASLISNAVKGVVVGWSKTLVLVGTGYRARMEGKTLILALGFSHPIKFDPIENITYKVEENKITITGPNKNLVGQIAANIRSVRKPEPYQGKGVKYEDEIVRRKPGKSAKTAKV